MLYDDALQNSHEIIGPLAPTNFPLKYDHRKDVFDIAAVKPQQNSHTSSTAKLYSSWVWSHTKIHYQGWPRLQPLGLLQAVAETNDTRNTVLKSVDASVTVFTGQH